MTAHGAQAARDGTANTVPDTALRESVAQARRWYWQRVSAMVLAACVVLHLAGMVWAVRGGLSAAEILARTQGNALFAVFYALFVLACAVHVPIGLISIAREWWRWSPGAATWFARAVTAALVVLGLRAVWGVYAPGA
jgi:fumarate reductase subunit C